VGTEDRSAKPRYGIVNLEKRQHPRFSVDLPVEYSPTDLSIDQGRAVNASEGGLLLYLPEKMDIGNHLRLRLFFPTGSGLNTIETLVAVVWLDLHLGKDWGDYRAGVKFVEISAGDMDRLKNFLRSLSGEFP